MKFISLLPEEITGQIEELITVRDERTVDDPKKVPMARDTDQWWYNEGRNHRIENGHIVRDRDERHTTFETDLDEIMKLAEKYTGIAIEVRPDYGLPLISIYDPDDC